jgi:DNA-binding transcriptional ArsR family regulator
MLADLHPQVEYADDALRIRWSRWNSTSDLRGAGLVLVPCVFAWPAVVLTKDARQPMLTYPPRGIGRVWAGTSEVTASVAQLLGRSRATLLTRLDLPLSTTRLAADLGLTAASVSEHLSVLRRAGLVTSQRSGRSVLYQRTTLATRLLRTRAQG